MSAPRSRTSPWDPRVQRGARIAVARQRACWTGGIIQVIDKRDLGARRFDGARRDAVGRVNYARASAMVPSVQVDPDAARQGGGRFDQQRPGDHRDFEPTSPGVEEFVKGLDIRTPQVSIQAKIIFVDRTDVEELGVKYDLGSQTQFFQQAGAAARSAHVQGGGHQR